MVSFPTRILLATDGSEDAAAASRAAVDLSRKSGSELHVVHAWLRPREYSSPGVSHEVYVSAYRRHAEGILDKELRRVEEAGGTVTEAYLETGRPMDRILDLARETEAGLLVVGSRGLGSLRRITVGSVSEGVVHHARCPVLVVKSGQGTWPPRRLVVGYDGSEDAEKAAEVGATVAGILGVPMRLVRAHPEYLPTLDISLSELEPYEQAMEQNIREEQRVLEKVAEEIEGKTGVRPEVEIVKGEAAVVLENAADTESLVAVGSRGLGAVRRMTMGSVSTKVLRAARGPVLIHPHSRDRSSVPEKGEP